jgi:hypothetical protein
MATIELFGSKGLIGGSPLTWAFEAWIFEVGTFCGDIPELFSGIIVTGVVGKTVLSLADISISGFK